MVTAFTQKVEARFVEQWHKTIDVSWIIKIKTWTWTGYKSKCCPPTFCV